MNVLPIFYLLGQDWIDYCKSHFLNAPCDPPPGPDHSFAIITVACVMFAVIVAASSIFQVISHLRISTPEEFREANKRLAVGMPLLVSLRGKRLREHCRATSRDALQVTGFARSHVSLCFHRNYLSYSRNNGRVVLMMLFMRENTLLRHDAALTTLLYFLPLTAGPLVRQAKAMMGRYSETWLPLFEQYSIENPECQDHF